MADVTVRSFESIGSGRVLDGHASFGRRREEPVTLHGFVARSLVMQVVCRHLERLAPCTRGTLVSGEIGTGKSLAVAAAQRLGPLAHGPAVTLDGSVDDAAVLVMLGDAARGSETALTCIVPELRAVSHEVQAALVAGLKGSDALPIGQGLHVVAAVASDPIEEMRQGRLRSDLFYQVGAVRYHMPPLADRLEDLPDLAALALRDACRRQGRSGLTLAAAALDALEQRPWPGNMHELRNVMARAAALTEGGVVGLHAVREAFAMDAPWPRPARVAGERRELDAGARVRVTAALSAAGGNKSAAAQHLGLSRRSLYRLLERLDAPVQDATSPSLVGR